MLCLVVAPAAVAASCPTTTNAKAFASAGQLRKLVRQENRFGERYLASRAHNRTIGWIEDEVSAIKGFKVRSDPFKVWTLAAADEGQGPARGSTSGARGPERHTGRDRAGGRRGPLVQADHEEGQKGQLVYLAADQDITAANSAGKVVVRDFPGTALPYAAFGIIGVYVTPDLASASGAYERPFLNELHQELLAASKAGAAGVVFTFDVPRKQVAGYGDPHTGTIFKVPALFVGGAEAKRLRALAAQGASARVRPRQGGAGEDRERHRDAARAGARSGSSSPPTPTASPGSRRTAWPA